MSVNDRYTAVDTRFGWVILAGSDRGLSLASLPLPSREAALGRVQDSIRDAVEDAVAFGDLPLRLQRYFRGEAIGFTDMLDHGDASAFQRAVWEATRSIPHGSVETYGSVAAAIGKPRASRAVGRALGQNNITIIVPCHRVVASNGLGGFGGGLALKRRLLGLEEGRVSVTSSRPLR